MMVRIHSEVNRRDKLSQGGLTIQFDSGGYAIVDEGVFHTLFGAHPHIHVVERLEPETETVASAVAEVAEPTDWSAYTIAELRAELASRGVTYKQRDTKAALIALLEGE